MYFANQQRKFRLFLHKGQLYRTTSHFPCTDGERSFPFLEDEDWMNKDALCLFLRHKLKDRTPRP